MRQKLGWVLIFASSVPKVFHALCGVSQLGFCCHWEELLELLPLSMGQMGSNKGSQEDFSSYWLVPGGLSGWVLALELLFGGHLVDSAGFKGNLEQSSG